LYFILFFSLYYFYFIFSVVFLEEYLNHVSQISRTCISLIWGKVRTEYNFFLNTLSRCIFCLFPPQIPILNTSFKCLCPKGLCCYVTFLQHHQ
jgi:hypothetical protein